MTIFNMQNNGSSIWWCETFILALRRDDEASRHQHQPPNQPCYWPGEVRKCTDYSGEEKKKYPPACFTNSLTQISVHRGEQGRLCLLT